MFFKKVNLIYIRLIAIGILIFSKTANASNFGNFPAVLPIFFMGVIFTLFWAAFVFYSEKYKSRATGQKIAIFFGRLLFGCLISFVLLVLLFFTTF